VIVQQGYRTGPQRERCSLAVLGISGGDRHARIFAQVERKPGKAVKFAGS
jgi:hypothetical protein